MGTEWTLFFQKLNYSQYELRIFKCRCNAFSDPGDITLQKSNVFEDGKKLKKGSLITCILKEILSTPNVQQSLSSEQRI